MLLESGDRVPTDLRLRESHNPLRNKLPLAGTLTAQAVHIGAI